MKIVGCDLHTRYQQIAMLDRETGELIERRLEHESGEGRVAHPSRSVFRSPNETRVPHPSRVLCAKSLPRAEPRGWAAD